MSSTSRKPKIVVIVGPTASGKSALAAKLARKFNGEIVSADSRQIYRGMDIGTAKYRPNSPRIKTNYKRIFAKNSVAFGNHSGEVRHHLVNIKNPDEDYTVADYKKDAVTAIRKILKKGKLPILVGGTGLYVRAVVNNLDIPAVAADQKLRLRLESEAKKHGSDYLFKKLIKLDPEAAHIVDPKNPRRIIRALEIATKTGRPFSAQRKIGQPLFNALLIGINAPKNQLKKKINARVDEMLKNGLVDEVGGLIKKYGAEQKALRRGSVQAFDAIGYKEIIKYLRNEISLKKAANLIKNNTWRYAKRQLMWFKKDKSIKWIARRQNALTLISRFLKKDTP